MREGESLQPASSPSSPALCNPFLVIHSAASCSFSCIMICFSVSILASSSLLCLSPTTDCFAQRAQRRREQGRGREAGREEREGRREKGRKKEKRGIIRRMSEGEINEFMRVRCTRVCVRRETRKNDLCVCVCGGKKD